MLQGGNQEVTIWHLCDGMGLVHKLGKGLYHSVGTTCAWIYVIWSLGSWAALGQLEHRLSIGYSTSKA